MRINFIYQQFQRRIPSMSKLSTFTTLIFTFAALFLLAGCSTLSGPSLTAERYMACPQDAVWKGALEALEHYPITVNDKTAGLIETDWRIQPVAGRPYGLLGREGLGDKERSRLTILVKPLQEGVVALTLTERRHHWGFRGGARLYEWYPIEPSQESINNIINQITAQLDQEGCIVES
ncbi:MAG: hypothetical protein O2999_10755 [Nitrospirae bacterium]|nr:hypothetical protein [Nitrospirota bacterium]